jgi:hypothetical protein
MGPREGMARLFGAKLYLRIGFRPIGLSLHAVNPTQTVGVIRADPPFLHRSAKNSVAL